VTLWGSDIALGTCQASIGRPVTCFTLDRAFDTVYPIVVIIIWAITKWCFNSDGSFTGLTVVGGSRARQAIVITVFAYSGDLVLSSHTITIWWVLDSGGITGYTFFISSTCSTSSMTYLTFLGSVIIIAIQTVTIVQYSVRIFRAFGTFSSAI
jgi:hypothetical protein